MRRVYGFFVVALLGALALAGCGAPSASRGSGNGAANDATPVTTIATVISDPTATLPITPSPTPQPTCGAPLVGQDHVPTVAFDGMIVASTAWMSNTAYPERQVPNSAPLAPYSTARFNGSVSPTDTQVNPNVGEGDGYTITLCNTSGRARRIDGITMTIARLTPFSGALRIWKPCESWYDAQSHQVSGGGCGGANIQNDYMVATFSAGAGAGVSAIAKMVEVSPALTPVLGPLPVTLQPNEQLSVSVGVNGLPSTATYTFTFALGVDGAAPQLVATSQPTLLAPPTQIWTGENCLATAMQAQMPPSGQFVCPPAS